MTEARPTSRRSRILKRALVSLVALVVSLLLAEGGMRLWLQFKGRPFDAQAQRREMRKLLSPIAQFVPTPIGETLADGAPRPILQPFYASEQEHDSGGVLSYFRERARPRDFVILMLGGSVAAELGGRQSSAIRGHFQGLTALADRRVVFLSGAHPAHKQPQQLNRLGFLLAFGYRPDLVIVLDGFNETALAAENAQYLVHPLWPTGPAWSAVVEDQRAMPPELLELTIAGLELRRRSSALALATHRLKLDRSALGSQFVLWRLASMSRERLSLQTELGRLARPDLDERALRQIRGADYDPEWSSVLDLSVRAWAECSRSLRALCESRSVAYVHCLQPALFDMGSKPFSKEESQIQNPHTSWLEGARDGYPRLRAAGLELVAEGLRFVDLSRAFADVQETLYVDPCHFNPRGNELLARALLDGFPPEVLTR
ncbi:MAG: hypothetical protein JNK02_06205 [Planctomycetes bacterium]|nr:hypothetical protein [Planctomycetota bacterium]